MEIHNEESIKHQENEETSDECECYEWDIKYNTLLYQIKICNLFIKYTIEDTINVEIINYTENKCDVSNEQKLIMCLLELAEDQLDLYEENNDDEKEKNENLIFEEHSELVSYRIEYLKNEKISDTKYSRILKICYYNNFQQSLPK
jgi:hypothetical protein